MLAALCPGMRAHTSGYAAPVAHEPSGRRVAARALAWLALFGLWFAIAGTVDYVEAIGAAVAATLALIATIIVRDRLADPVGVDRTWLPELARVPQRVLRDWGDLARALWRARDGHAAPSGLHDFDYQPAPAGPKARSRAALTILAGSIAPNAYVVTIDRAEHRARVHMLVDRNESPLPRVAQGRGERDGSS